MPYVAKRNAAKPVITATYDLKRWIMVKTKKNPVSAIWNRFRFTKAGAFRITVGRIAEILPGETNDSTPIIAKRAPA